MINKIKVQIMGEFYEVASGIKVIDLVRQYVKEGQDQILACYVNNVPHNLKYVINEDHSQVDWIYKNSSMGQLIYKKSMSFLLHRVVFELYRNARIVLGTSIGNGYYYDLFTDTPVTDDLLNEIGSKMHDSIENQDPFDFFYLSKEKTEEYLQKRGFFNKLKLVQQQEKDIFTVCSSGHYKDIESIPLVPHSGYLKEFWLKKYKSGFLLYFTALTDKKHHLIQLGKKAKMFETFSESRRWGRIIAINTVSRLNDIIIKGDTQRVVNICETFHEKKLSQIADEICFEREMIPRIILISGPSSSGKTTFTRKLSIHLQVNGLRPEFISLDNYYVDRVNTPLDENGEYDFEHVEALDLELLNHHLSELINGNEINTPIFDFEKGVRKEESIPLRVDEYQPLILEGIHALNPILTESIEDHFKYKIYISALTPLSIDDYNRISSSDNRLLRRIVRDYKYRNYSAIETIKRWDSVRAGEEKYIFPFQENADVHFNSAHHFEISVLKQQAEQLLEKIEPQFKEYRTAYRLLNLLSFFRQMDINCIPQTSILREFLGGSCFKY